MAISLLVLLVACEWPPPAFRNGDNGVGACVSVKEEGCFWLEPRPDGTSCWIPAAGVDGQKACRERDACATGGACYKWADCSECEPKGKR